MTESQSRRKGILIIIALVLSGLASTSIIYFLNLDLRLSAALHEGRLGETGWLIGKQTPWAEFYRYGEYPAVIMAIAAFISYVLSRVGKFPVKFSKPCLVIVLTVVLGSGLLVNGILKSCWGRPRPADIIEFGGTASYRSVFSPAGPGGGKSFVCGHCANAFAIASGASFFPYFPRLAGLFMGLGLSLGLIASFARIAQGGHYLSDTVWAGIIVLVIIAWLYFCVFKIPAISRYDAGGDAPP